MPIDFSNAWNTGVRNINETISLLPNLLLALLIFAAFLRLAAAGKFVARRWVQRQRKLQGIALLLARLVQTCILILGFLIVLSVVARSLAGDLIKLLGVGTVAIGFAFQNILQNFLAGILLPLQEPFQLGDFISVTGVEGTVSAIQPRDHSHRRASCLSTFPTPGTPALGTSTQLFRFCQVSSWPF